MLMLDLKRGLLPTSENYLLNSSAESFLFSIIGFIDSITSVGD
jgi:hypothetical protein